MDGRKDLLIGRTDGTVKLYLNVNTDNAPEFDAGAFLQVGEPELKTNIDVGYRATPTVLDWNNDGKRDLVAGALDGRVRVYTNEGTDSSWDFRIVAYAQEDGADLVVPSQRASPHVADIDDDGKKDLLLGNTEGQLLLYTNVGSDEAPLFSGSSLVDADGIPIDLAGYARSRPFVCDWDGDGLLDALVGSGDGLVRLYRGVDVATAIPGEEPPAAVVRLLDVYPNPFNPSVTIRFELSEPRYLRLVVHGVTGQHVAVLADREYGEGRHEVVWRGVNDEGQEVPSGVYFVRLRGGGIPSTRKAVLLR